MTAAEDAKKRAMLDVARGKAIKAERDERIRKPRVGDKVPYPGHVGGTGTTKGDRDEFAKHLEGHADQLAHEMRMNRPRVITARVVQQALMDGKACPCCLAINDTHRSACLYKAFERANNQQHEMHEAIASARRFATELLRQLR